MCHRRFNAAWCLHLLRRPRSYITRLNRHTTRLTNNKASNKWCFWRSNNLGCGYDIPQWCHFFSLPRPLGRWKTEQKEDSQTLLPLLRFFGRNTSDNNVWTGSQPPAPPRIWTPLRECAKIWSVLPSVIWICISTYWFSVALRAFRSLIITQFHFQVLKFQRYGISEVLEPKYQHLINTFFKEPDESLVLDLVNMHIWCFHVFRAAWLRFSAFPQPASPVSLRRQFWLFGVEPMSSERGQGRG